MPQSPEQHNIVSDVHCVPQCFNFLLIVPILLRYLPCRRERVWACVYLPPGALYQQHGLVPLRVPEGLHADGRQEVPGWVPNVPTSLQCPHKHINTNNTILVKATSSWGECDCASVSPPDIDECVGDRSLCQPFGSCKNRPGSYTCECSYGFILSEDKHSCESKYGCLTLCVYFIIIILTMIIMRYVVYFFIGCIALIDYPKALCVALNPQHKQIVLFTGVESKIKSEK